VSNRTTAGEANVEQITEAAITLKLCSRSRRREELRKPQVARRMPGSAIDSGPTRQILEYGNAVTD
jgi:hypothetical protein